MSGGCFKGNRTVVFALLMIFTGLCNGLEDYVCNATWDRAQCYVALGGTLYLQLLTDATQNEVKFRKWGEKNEDILKTRQHDVVITDPYQARLHFYVDNGTLRINNTEQADYGEYNFTAYLDGKPIQDRRILLIGDGASWPVIISSLAAVVLVVVGGGCFLRWKRQRQASDVSDQKAEGGGRRKAEPEEVQYGQVHVLPGPRGTTDKPKMEDTIYAQIQPGQ